MGWSIGGREGGREGKEDNDNTQIQVMLLTLEERRGREGRTERNGGRVGRRERESGKDGGIVEVERKIRRSTVFTETIC